MTDRDDEYDDVFGDEYDDEYDDEFGDDDLDPFYGDVDPEEVDSDEPTQDGVGETFRSMLDRPEKDHSTIGAVGAKLVSTVPKPLLGIRGTLYKRMVVKGLENYHKTAGGDAVAINAKAGQQIDLEPVIYRTPEEVDEGEKPGWKVKGRDKVWNPAKEGNSVNYLGRTPLVNLEDDEHVEAGWLAPRAGHAIELDNYWPIFRDAQINAVIDAGQAAPGANGARADGGQMSVDLELDKPGKWAGDNLIDLGSGDGYDGMRISTAKAREWQAEHTDSEHMQMQEDRGYLRGLASGDDTDVVRIFLYAALLVIGVLAVVLLGPELVGGSDGGGGMNPLMIDMAATLL